jgi:hypothetical protein
VGAAVEHAVRGRRLFHRHDVGDQPDGVDLAVDGEPEEGPVEPGLVPPPRDGRRHPADLRADQAYAVVVEFVAEPQPDAVALIEASRDHPAVDRDRADRVVQRPVGAADLDGHVGAATVGEPAQLRPDHAVAGVDDGAGAVLQGLLEAAGDRVDRHHRAAGEPDEPGGEQPQHALAEHGDGLAEVDVRGEHRVQRDRAHPREGRRDRIEAVRERAAAQLLGGHDRLPAVTPDAPDLCADRWHGGVVGDIGGDFDHLAHLRVPEPGHRVAEAAGVVDEQPQPGIPGLVEVGVRAAVGGQFGAGRDAGEAGAHAYLAGSQLGGGLLDDLHAARRGELDYLRHSDISP